MTQGSEDPAEALRDFASKLCGAGERGDYGLFHSTEAALLAHVRAALSAAREEAEARVSHEAFERETALEERWGRAFAAQEKEISAAREEGRREGEKARQLALAKGYRRGFQEGKAEGRAAGLREAAEIPRRLRAQRHAEGDYGQYPAAFQMVATLIEALLPKGAPRIVGTHPNLGSAGGDFTVAEGAPDPVAEERERIVRELRRMRDECDGDHDVKEWHALDGAAAAIESGEDS